MTNQTQCSSCAFLYIEDQSTHENDRAVEAKYAALRNTYNSPEKQRHIFLGDKRGDRTETCFINSHIFIDDYNEKHCPDRIDHALSLSDALAFRNSSAANKAAEEANRVASKAVEIAREEAASARIAADAAVTQARFAKWSAIIAAITAIVMINEQINSTISILFK